MTIDAALRDIATGSGPVALVTVARVSGSTPRGTGSRMAVRADGAIVGTVGGGLPEARAREAALAALAEGRQEILRVEMTGKEAIGAELICGGVVELWIEVVTDRSSYAAAAAAIDRGGSAVIACSGRTGCVAVIGAEGKAIAGLADGLDQSAIARAREGRLPVMSEVDGLLYAPIEGKERLLILGGGHVGLALARAAASLSFRVTVADPRPEFSDPGRFPAEVECSPTSFEEAIAGFPAGPSAYIVIVSPGHLGDLECARAALVGEYRYVGLIGSRRKCRMIIERLIAEGIPAEKAESLRAPIGLDIGAETPEEIAVAIAAELIAVRKDSASLGWIDEDRKRRRAI